MSTDQAHQPRQRPRWRVGRAWLREARRTHNPLLRRPTRRQRIIALTGCSLLVLGVIGTIVMTVLVFRAGSTAERVQARERTSVIATVQGSADPKLVGERYLSGSDFLASYSWKGATRQGVLQAPTGAVVGEQVHAWVDRDGQLVPEPQTRLTSLVQTGWALLLAASVLAALGTAGVAGYRSWSLRQHFADWDEEWQRWGPHSRR